MQFFVSKTVDNYYDHDGDDEDDDDIDGNGDADNDDVNVVDNSNKVSAT